MAELQAKMDLGVADVIRAVDEIMSRRRNRRADDLADLCDDLEAVHEVVSRLDSLFMDCIVGFTDPGLVEDPDLLRNHVAVTRSYLTRRELLPRLEHSIGALRAAAANQRFAANVQMVGAVYELLQRLERYRGGLGEGGVTGVGHYYLRRLCDLAEGKDPIDQSAVLDIAKDGLLQQDFELSGSIFRLIGFVRTFARGAR